MGQVRLVTNEKAGSGRHDAQLLQYLLLGTTFVFN